VTPRCPRCGYALMRDGVCPIHGGRQVAERLPMPAPLPARVDVVAIRKRKRRRSA
jgi:uncharacterized Zn finger protein (UPF0148 family)